MGMEILSGRRLLPEDFNPTEHSLLSYLDKMCNSSFREQERSSPSALHNHFHVFAHPYAIEFHHFRKQHFL